MEVKIRKTVRNFLGGEMINPAPPATNVNLGAALTLSFLEPLFQGFRQVFVGSISNMVELGGPRIKKDEVLIGFRQLKELGWITIEGDEFTPTKAYLDARVLKTSKWHREP